MSFLPFEGPFGGLGVIDFDVASTGAGGQSATTATVVVALTVHAPYASQPGSGTAPTEIGAEPAAPCTVEVAEVPWCYPTGGNVRLGTLPEVANPMGRESTDRDEWLTCEVPVASDGFALLRPRRILRIVTAPTGAAGGYYEARIGRIEVVETPGGSFARITARGLANDLTDCGAVRYGGLYSFTATKTPTQWIDDVILPTLAAAGFGYVARGTVDFTDNFSRSVEWETPYELLNWLATETRGEWYLRRNGTTSYAIDLVVQYGSSAPTGYLVAGAHLASVASDADDGTQATHVIPKGNGSVEALRVASWALWKVTDKSSSRLTLGSPSGATGQLPICVDDQFNNYVLVNLKTGERFTVTDTFYASQEVAVAATSSFATGDMVWLLASSTGAIAVPDIGASGFNQISVYKATVSGNDIALAEEANTGIDVLVTSEPWSLLGATLKAYAPGPMGVGYSAISVLVTDVRWRLTVSSSTGVSVDNILHISASTTAPFLPIGQWFKVVAVPDGTTIDVERLWSQARGTTITNPGGGVGLNVWVPRAGSTTVTATTAATDTVTVASASAANVATGDLVLFSRSVGGTIIEALSHPAAAAYYPGRLTRVYAADISSGALFTVDQNAWVRNWGGSTPTGWVGTATKNADTTAYGPWMASLSGSGGTLYTGLTRLDPSCRYWAVVLEGETNASGGGVVRAGFFFANDAFTGGTYGTLGNVSSPALNGTLVVIMDLQATTYTERELAALHGPVRAFVYAAAGGGTATANVRALGILPLPDYAAPDQYALPEFNMASQVWSKANIWVQTHAYTPTSYEAGIADLERVDPRTYTNAKLSLGGTVRIVADDAGVDSSLRVVAIERNFTVKADTRVTLANQLVTITRLLGGSA